ncbi:MAG: FAD:protein FMN transferase [Pseudomonadota bacterium]|nr:FAD:protein FMN transferase [Pseudomonadota bacterium]
MAQQFKMEQRGPEVWRGTFAAMASPCEVLIEGADRTLATRVTRIVSDEALRIEAHWSRYRPGNIIHAINTANGKAVRVDDETADMLDYAAMLFELSDGKFDITAGVLRRVWRFDGSDKLPTQATVTEILASVGWAHVCWERPLLTMAPGMELDFGGIGKEYAVDRALAAARAVTDAALLVNFGGDLACDRDRADSTPWTLGVESIGEAAAVPQIALRSGGVATSGDANRFLQRDGIRYGHVLDARTGWPVPGAPHAVTVAAQSCTLAGMLATLAMLQGDQANSFLAAQDGIRYFLQP